MVRNEFSDYKEKVQFNNKTERYQSIINSMDGLYQSGTRDSCDFIKDYRLCWVHASDEVTKKASEFISAMQDNSSMDKQKIITEKFNEFILSIRQDMIKDTKLKASDFQHAGGHKHSDDDAAISEFDREKVKIFTAIQFDITVFNNYLNFYGQYNMIEESEDVFKILIAKIQREISKLKKK